MAKRRGAAQFSLISAEYYHRKGVVYYHRKTEAFMRV